MIINVAVPLPSGWAGIPDDLEFYLVDSTGGATGPFSNATTAGTFVDSAAPDAGYIGNLTVPAGFVGIAPIYGPGTELLLTVSVSANDHLESVADGILDRANGVETGRTLRQIIRGMASALLGKVSGGGTTFRDVNDAKNRITSTVDENGNRTTVGLDLT